jgi:hypothetical protein
VSGHRFHGSGLFDPTRRQLLGLLTASPALAQPRQAPSAPEDLARGFATPPDSARSWVYWFWKNGNISREGITADLEAMARVGIGGVIMMEVALTTPKGPVRFFSPEWRELFRHTVREAGRLGIQITVNSAPGWTGSGGWWVKPEQSMQKVVATATQVNGPRAFSEALEQPQAVAGFYADIAVLAFLTPRSSTPARIEAIDEKALYVRGPYSSQPKVRAAFTPAGFAALPPDTVIDPKRIIDLTSRMDAGGRLTWDVPEGRWTIMRFGRTSTGQNNRPAPLAGLECDKLDKGALDEHFRQFTAQLVRDAGGLAGKTLIGTHLDSWEVGAQNWSAGFAAEFKARRGYDAVPFLPVMTGRVIESAEVSERFLWDLRQTLSEVMADNHGRYMRELAARFGLELSIEPYDMMPGDDMTFGATADVPMCEFWAEYFDARYSVKEATSIGHVYGKPVIAAEAFTSGPNDCWKLHPGVVKAIGDWAFSEGVNRMVVHRYVHQPFGQVHAGLSLARHGLHCERTSTWFDYSGPWHRYMARCQYLLQQGSPVADALYVSPEGAPNVFQPPRPQPVGFKYDALTPEALLTRVNVKEGKLVLPDGSAYALLVLPEWKTMTPRLLAKLDELVAAGAMVAGMPPEKSPSLQNYPKCDEEVGRLAKKIWGACTAGAEAAVANAPKAPPVVCGARFQAAAPLGGVLDGRPGLQRIWVRDGDPREPAHFRRVFDSGPASAIDQAVVELNAAVPATLYVNGRGVAPRRVEWELDRARVEGYRRNQVFDIGPALRDGQNIVAVALDGNPSHDRPSELAGAIFIRQRDRRETLVVTDSRWLAASKVAGRWNTTLSDGEAGWAAAAELGPLKTTASGSPVQSDVYPPSREIEGLLRRLGQKPDFEAEYPLRFAHRRLSGDWDIYFVANPERRRVECVCVFRVSGRQPEMWHPETGESRMLPRFSATGDGRTVVPLRFEAEESYFVMFRAAVKEAPGGQRGATAVRERNFPDWRPVVTLSGPWEVRFEASLGGPPEPVKFTALEDWAKRPEAAIRYYSGTAVYRTRFDLGARAVAAAGPRLMLDLGAVEAVARVRLNGQDLGIAWRSPYRLEAGTAARVGGGNELEIEVANLWPNRMIGDASLPEDSEWTERGVLKAWPQWLLEGKPSPTGRVTFSNVRPYKADSALLPSGLLGPVTVLGATLPR